MIEVSILLELCAVLNVKPGTVRTAISRLKKQGLLSAKKVPETSCYTLTPKAIITREFYNKKIFIGEDVYLNWQNDWWLLCFSFENSQEKLRTRLRALLKSMDFGCLSRGVWLKPVDSYLWLDQVLENKKLNQGVDVFKTGFESLDKAREMVNRLWNIKAIAQYYEVYEDRLRTQFTDHHEWDEMTCFRMQMKLFLEFIDPLVNSPLLPPQLFPNNWPGITYRELFKRTNERLMIKSRRFFNSLTTL